MIELVNKPVDLQQLLQEFDTVKHLQLDERGSGIDLKLRVKRNHTWLYYLPYTKQLSEQLGSYYPTQVIYRTVMPNKAYRWHKDIVKYYYHIPLITNPDCYFLYENSKYSMQAGKLYRTQVDILHTFSNSGSTPRTHLMFEDYSI